MSWNVVQSAGALNFATSISVTFTTANVSSGNKIIAYVASASSTVPTGVQDGSGNHLTLVASSVAVSPTGGAWIYAMDVPAGDAGTKPTITASGLGSNGITIIVQEVSGLAPGSTAAIDGTAGTLTGTATSTGSPSYSSAAANEYLVCFFGDHQGATPTALSSPWVKDANSQTSQSHASLEYTNSTGGAETSGWTATSTNGWEVVTVAFKLAPLSAPLVTPPPLIPPHPLFPETLLGEAYQRADWQAQGVADLTVAFASTSGGVDTYNTDSPWNVDVNGSTREHMRVLKPTSAANLNYPHAFLIMLPVDSDQGTTFGDSIGTAQAISANDQYNLTIVQPGYALLASGSESWFGDNPLNPGISEEKFTLLVTAWIQKNLAVTGTEKVYLIGFSRSGLAAQFLQFRHPYLFSAVASWDSCFMMTDYDGTDPTLGSLVGGHPEVVFGTSSSFTTNYELTAAHLTNWQATGQYATNRIWIGKGPDFQADDDAYPVALTAAGIPHTYTFSNTGETHAWHTDWVASALATIIPSSYAQATTVLPQQVPRPLLTQMLELAAWRVPGAAPPAVTSAAANAQLATGTGTAQGATAAVAVNAGLATGTGTAQGAVPAIAVNAALASGAATAQNATASTSASGTANAVLASGAGTAQSPVAAIGVNAAAATGTGAAQGATVQTSGSANVTAVLAAAAGAAQSPATAIAVNAAAATGTATAQGAGRAATAGLASGTGAAQAAALAVAANAAAAQGLAAALGITTAVVTPGTLTATTAATATLTAGDQRTGGPG